MRAVITTAPEVGLVSAHAESVGALVVVHTDAATTVASAVQALSGKLRFSRVVVGIDPGERPGVAVLGDGVLVATAHAANPEAAADEAERAVRTVPADRYVVRVGHGAPTQRDRILVALAAKGIAARVELVDETNSTPATYRSPAERDTTAAAAIALARGAVVAAVRQPLPSDGEVRDIQRKSRVHSEGELTISRELAHAVAVGELTLDEAVKSQRGKKMAT